ncbi:MAG: hypothetical protein AAGF26_00455 [Cyanobacteria bacterium P01_G01_bin.49]
MKQPIRLVISPTLLTNLAAVSEENTYQTTCYHRQDNQLVDPQSCTVIMQFEHPDHGLNWKIITRSGQVHHYRNQGTGIELWSHLGQEWLKVQTIDWVSSQKGILCWDDFCADWREIPLD